MITEILSLMLRQPQPPPKPAPAPITAPDPRQGVAGDDSDALIALGLFVASELIGMSKLRSNSLLQLILHMGQELFPYELQKKQPATRANRPRIRRNKNGQFTGGD